MARTELITCDVSGEAIEPGEPGSMQHGGAVDLFAEDKDGNVYVFKVQYIAADSSRPEVVDMKGSVLQEMLASAAFERPVPPMAATDPDYAPTDETEED